MELLSARKRRRTSPSMQKKERKVGCWWAAGRKDSGMHRAIKNANEAQAREDGALENKVSYWGYWIGLRNENAGARQ